MWRQVGAMGLLRLRGGECARGECGGVGVRASSGVTRSDTSLRRSFSSQQSVASRALSGVSCRGAASPCSGWVRRCRGAHMHEDEGGTCTRRRTRTERTNKQKEASDTILAALRMLVTLFIHSSPLCLALLPSWRLRRVSRRRCVTDPPSEWRRHREDRARPSDIHRATQQAAGSEGQRSILVHHLLRRRWLTRVFASRGVAHCERAKSQLPLQSTNLSRRRPQWARSTLTWRRRFVDCSSRVRSARSRRMLPLRPASQLTSSPRSRACRRPNSYSRRST